ncbi:MAG: ATP-binding cassette domain-containing protein [Leptospira sp.]|nr:ATP-binding cassette domain-containing protein [Leptospira sp.]
MESISDALKKELLQEDIINHLTSEEFKTFIELFKQRTLTTNERIESKGTSSVPLLLVMSGRIQIHFHQNNSDLFVKSLTEGQFYGISELALGLLNSITFIADENSSLLLIPQDQLLAFFEATHHRKKIWNEFIDNVKLRDELRIHPFFRKLAKHELVELSHLVIKRNISKGKVLIKEGSKSDSLFFVYSGKFKITKSTWSDNFFSFVESGSVIGEMGVIERKERNATVTAEVESIVYELTAKDAETFFKKSESLFVTLKSLTTSRKINHEEKESEESITHESDDFFEDILHFLPESSFPPKIKNIKSFPIFIEDSSDQTAFACRQMLLAYWGYDKKLETDDNNFPKTDWEVSMQHWKDTFSDIGQTLVIDLLRFRKELERRIYIVRWETNKFVIVLPKKDNTIKIIDPSTGFKEITESEWNVKTGKHAVLFIPKIKPKINLIPSFDYFPGLYPFFKQYLPFLYSGILATFLIKALEITLPLINLYLIDNVLIREKQDFFYPILISVATISISQIVLSYFRSNVVNFSTTRVNQAIIIRFLEKLLSLPLTYFENHRKGEILQRWDEIEGVTNFFSEQGTLKFLDWIFGLIVFLIFLFLSPILLSVIIFFLIPEIYIVSRLSPLIERETKKESLRSADTLSYFIETINGNETVKNLGSVSVQRWDFEKRLTSQLNAEGKRMFYTNILDSSSLTFKLLTNVSILVLGTFLIFQNQITLGTLFGIIGLIAYVRSPMISLVQDGVRYQKAKLAWKRLMDWEKLDSEYTSQSKISKVEIPDIQGDLVLKDVSFSYKIGKRNFEILKLNVKFETGKKYAFVGRSGSGKSSIVKLILGLYERSDGDILLDGVSMEEIWLPSFRNRVGVLFQENPILLGTIRENITLARPDSTLSEVVEASKLALFHEDVIALPLGYDTELSEKGVILSAGQKQKLAFARLFLQKPSLLVLDEPTSSMDSESEAKIFSNLHRVFSDKTIITVAHRLETVRRYDQIFVMEHGKLEERGTHKELINTKGIYHLLHSKQEAIR